MEQTQKIELLFMDDEPESPIIQNCLIRLRQAGYTVNYVETISEAIAAFYHHYYDFFILDIDMSHVAEDQHGDGVELLKRFVSLHNQAKVILYSGAGTVGHWFDAASVHCAGYIAKDESIEDETGEIRDSITLLMEKIDQLTQKQFPENECNEPEGQREAWLLCGDDALLLEQCEPMLSALPYKTVTLNLTEAANSELKRWRGIIIWQRQFPLRSTTLKTLDRLLMASPCPHVVVGCDGEDRYRDSILYIANRQPFRFIDRTRPDALQRLQAAVEKAERWFGQKEIFQADNTKLQRLHITAPEEYLASWQMED
ncbi:MAG: response regulator [Gammaproteobacteria bacterium]|nr:response regulator [Gammaproteobacteria bacterium]